MMFEIQYLADLAQKVHAPNRLTIVIDADQVCLTLREGKEKYCQNTGVKLFTEHFGSINRNTGRCYIDSDTPQKVVARALELINEQSS